jgi:hypothetical protein
MPQEGGFGNDIQIKCTYDISDNDVIEFLKVMDIFYKRLIELIIPYKLELKSKDFSIQFAKALFKHPIYRPTDAVSGEEDLTKTPSQYYKIKNSYNQKTTFHSLI